MNPVPASLTVVSSGLASLNCSGSHHYGVQDAITDQVWNNSNPPQKMQVAGMTPCESGTLIGRATRPFGPVGAATGANGQFVDNPVGTCANLPFSKNLTGTLTIQMLLNGTYYPVRANNWTESDYQRQRCYSDEVTRETFASSGEFVGDWSVQRGG